MDGLIANGRLIDLILAFIAVEAVALLIYWRSTGRGLAPVSILLMLLPGACLLLALRGALIDAGPEFILLWLAAALIAHLADLWRRFRSS